MSGGKGFHLWTTYSYWKNIKLKNILISFLICMAFIRELNIRNYIVTVHVNYYLTIQMYMFSCV